MKPALKYISSRDNPFFKELSKLRDYSRQRKKNQQTFLDGVHLVQAYLAAGEKPLHLLITPAADQNQEIAVLLEGLSGVPVTVFDSALFNELTELKTPSGLLALVALPSISLQKTSPRFGVLLENIQDPGNLGSILRTAAASGCDAIFLSEGCADVWSPKVLRAAMGGHFVLKINEGADLVAVAREFDGVVFATALNATKSLYQCNFRGNVAFAFGNEGAGISTQLLHCCEQSMVIPMPGKVESLNVAAAAAVCLFEAVRQRN